MSFSFRRLMRGLAAAGLIAVSATSHADVIYQFSFSGIQGKADFGVTLQFANYVTTTGMQAVVPTSQGSLASLGYAVNYAGANSIGWWAFDDDTNGVITDGSYVYGGSSFLFTTNLPNAGYFTAPGIHTGFVGGNAPGSFSGNAVLTISETGGAVPEPESLALVLLALGGVAAATRRRSV